MSRHDLFRYLYLMTPNEKYPNALVTIKEIIDQEVRDCDEVTIHT